MNDHRPDPDALLSRVQQEEARAGRGRLKIFFGANAGVGKTYAMLAAARQLLAQGRPVLIGVVETHGRGDTESMARGLPRLSPVLRRHRDRDLPEFDLDGALEFGVRQPGALVLLDELAHSNVPGSRHPKRWQDAEELLAAGIDVWTTMNVQHLDSLNDVVSGITGIRVRETVPDSFFDAADEVVVVDLPPDELLQRLSAGKVYLPHQAERAAAHFFRKGNLLALRELALRRTADRVDGQIRAYRRETSTQAVWPNREALLACVGPGPAGEKVVRSCARMAAQLDVPWHAVWVESPQASDAQDRAQALAALGLAERLGAATATLSSADPARALIRYAREHNLVRLVTGRPTGRRWPWRRSLTGRLARLAPDLDLVQVAAAPAAAATQQAGAPAARTPWRWRGYAAAVLACGAVASLAFALLDVFELTNIVMLFLLVVVVVARVFGRGPAVLGAFLGVAVFDFFFVPPHFSLAVSDVQYLVTFAVMLVVALVIGQLTAGLKQQAEAATQRERRVRSLYAMARDLSSALLPEQVAEIGARFLQAEFQARSALLVADASDQLQPVPGGQVVVDHGVAQWAFDHGEPAGLGTDTLAASPVLVLPLKAPMRLRGVLAIGLAPETRPGPEQRRLLETCASLLAISLERIHYIDVASRTTVQMESERLRNSLLSAISHDLRTPLASLVGLAETLPMTEPPLSPVQREMAQAVRTSALRMSAQVDNLLEMARLQAGAVRLRLDWQPLEEVVGSALQSTESVLAGRPVSVAMPSDLPLLHLDAVLVERVLVNLVENALKYTPAGSALRIGARADESQVRLWVDDDGPGLPDGAEERLFEKFERGERESATPGVGLGLAICRAIMVAHGGQISGHNRVEQGRVTGARFLLSFPRGTPPDGDGADLLPGDARDP